MDVNLSSDEPVSKGGFNLLDMLPDDMIGACFFSGYLTQFEVVVGPSCVSNRMRRVAQHTVKALDLSKRNLSTDDIGSIVSRFANLSVRF